MRMYDLIMKKKQGKTLTEQEISFIVDGYTKESIPDYQMSAFLMAVCLQGMTDEETSALTMAMANSGDILDLSPIEGKKAEEFVTEETACEEVVSIDPLLEAYLDTDSYREKLNVLHGLQHRITEHMLNTMAIVIDFELPEGDIQTKYDALNDCLLTKEKYECNRII